MTIVERNRVVSAASPQDAMDVWVDTDRWLTWVDGFVAIDRRSESWPQVGGEIDWHSTPAGRGAVHERVQEYLAGRAMTVMFEDDRSSGRQRVSFAPAEEGDGVDVTLRQEYEIKGGGLFGRVTDYLFVRGAVGAALDRTLSHFGHELDHPLQDELDEARG
jgi:hypothetical protein